MNQAAVDTSLEGVRTAYPFNHALTYRLAGILNLLHPGRELNRYAGVVVSPIELKLQRSGLVPNAPPNLALTPHYAVHWRAHRQNNLVLAHKVARKHGMNTIASFRRVRGDWGCQTNPQWLSRRKLIAPKRDLGSTHNPQADEPAL
jgi:hypothetical protein